MARLTLTDLSKVYHGTAAVDRFSLDIDDAQMVVLVGPSGCGKTTILRMIAGLEKPDSGRILLDGRAIDHLAPKDRDIAMVFQSYALYPHMTVFDNMAFGLSLRKMAKADIRTRVQHTAELLGIADKLKRKPGRLSGGQRQRVALGRAMVRQPRVFLFDEPLSNLDAKLRVQMRAELGRLHRRLNTTMVYVTHDQVEAMTLADKIAVIRDGTLQQYDTPTAVYDRPANMFVAGFIGSPAMQVIPARSVPIEGGYFLQAEGLALNLAAPADRPWPSEVVVGIRPDDLSLRTEEKAADSLAVSVTLCENLGHCRLVHGRNGDRDIVAVMGGEVAIHTGEVMYLSIDPRTVHVFDPTRETALIGPEAGRIIKGVDR